MASPALSGAQSDGLTDYDLITRGTLRVYADEIREARQEAYGDGYSDYEGVSGYQRAVHSPKQVTDAPLSPRTMPVEAADLGSTTSDGGAGGGDVAIVDGDDRTSVVTETVETTGVTPRAWLPTNQKRAAEEHAGESASAPDAKRARAAEYIARQRLVRDVGQPPLLTVDQTEHQVDNYQEEGTRTTW